FANRIAVLMLRDRNFRVEWRLSNKDIGQLSDYLYANELFVQCLNLAYVRDRDSIIERLFLPPA
ncbi:MAG: hypothetical protein AAF639_16115, partial [Chloroflexota bacterium]